MIHCVECGVFLCCHADDSKFAQQIASSCTVTVQGEHFMNLISSWNIPRTSSPSFPFKFFSVVYLSQARARTMFCVNSSETPLRSPVKEHEHSLSFSFPLAGVHKLNNIEIHRRRGASFGEGKERNRLLCIPLSEWMSRVCVRLKLFVVFIRVCHFFESHESHSKRG